MNRTNLFLALLFLLLFACQPQAEKPIATIGKYNITASDVAVVAKINRLQPGNDTTVAIALYQLKEAYRCLSIADSLGFPVTDSLLASEKTRIDQHTLMPRRIDSIKTACGDSATYVRLFVLPQLARRWLYHQYYRLEHLHHQQGDSAKMFIEKCVANARIINVFEALSGVALEKTAKECGYPCVKFKVSKSEGIVPLVTPQKISDELLKVPGPKKPSNVYAPNMDAAISSKSTLMATQLVENVLCKMKVGEIYPHPVDAENAFWIVQYIDYFGGYYYITVIEIKKKDFFTWIGEVK